MKLSDLGIGTRLRAGFGLITLITALVGLFAIYQAQSLSTLTSDLYDHPYTVTNAMRDIRGHIRMVETILADMDPGVSPSKLDQFSRQLRDAEKNIRELFLLVHERFLGNQADIAVAEASFNEWCVLIDKAQEAHRDKLPEATQREAVRAARDHTLQLIHKTQAMIDFATNKAAEFNKKAAETGTRAIYFLAACILLACLCGMLVARYITGTIVPPLKLVTQRLTQISRGDLGEELTYHSGDEVGQLADAFRFKRGNLNAKIRLAESITAGDFSSADDTPDSSDALGTALVRMSAALRKAAEASTYSSWVKTGRNNLGALLAGEHDLRELSDSVTSFLAKYMGAQIGALYILADGSLRLTGSYAFTMRKDLADGFALGQGLVGQAALERQVISLANVPEGYIRINSALGDAQPRNIVVVPIMHDGQVKGVLELGSLEEIAGNRLEFLRVACDAVGVAINTVESQDRQRALLEQTQLQAEKLQIQQEELQASNEELEQQANALRSSEEELRQQQEEMSAINDELAGKNSSLELQRAELGLKNVELDNIRKGLELKASELEQTTRYKSEFLANMSHELRTPLNSLLLLSRSLMENQRGNMEADQVEYASIIHRSGNDLLALINEILDLSKIEAGRMTITPQDISLAELGQVMMAGFKPLAEEKGLALALETAPHLTQVIRTDRQRLEQIIRNLLSNAVKFCDTGTVTLSFRKPTPAECAGLGGLGPERALAISVTDTGVGIPQEKQQEIFEAFRQLEGGTDRRFGGTGLGLTISRELARLLGGELKLVSSPGQGSTFTLVIPAHLEISAQEAPRLESAATARPKAPEARACEPAEQAPSLPDDRDADPGDEAFILIVEDDLAFAGVLMDQCRAKGLLVLHAPTGEDGIALARTLPVGGIVLDIRLPGMNGWQVLEELKQDPSLRHIPVHVMSAEEGNLDAMRRGAVGFLGKPASRESLDAALEQLEGIMSKKVKDLLVVEDNVALRKGVCSLLSDASIRIREVETGEQALEALRQRDYDCMILDLGLPDMTGFELLDRLGANKGGHIPPVIVYTGRELTKEEESALRGHAESIIIKGVKSEERLIDETTLFLHQMVKSMPPKKRELIATLYDKDKALRGKTILLVDDDMRNLFALSHVLREHGLNVLKAEDGRKALETLQSGQEVDLVLLDIMMPVMDGYETLAAMRQIPSLAEMPVIALTAKAMLEDRERCIAAGANDYLSKPVDLDRLLSKLRVWLYSQ
ncbi:response regulator [Fundidesulfovibrio agrisoli]|uniref:response regulator n=1 Tax=Fundidesulfovibrio agrisoli TaxID=2922717 RepID=UPI001FAD84B3|nr:response regulator [Fundidesulfovibrio agrisoli]